MKGLLKNGISVLIILAIIILFNSCAKQEDSTEEKTTTTTQASQTEITTTEPEEVTTTTPAEVPPVEADDYNPAMWKLSDDNGNVMYMLGSMHMINDGDYPIPDKVMDAYNLCDSVAVECDVVNIDMEESIAMASYLVYPDGTFITDHVSDEAYQAMKSLLQEYDLFSPLYTLYNPFMFQSLISTGAATAAGFTAEGYDMHFIKLAEADSKDVLEVEGIALQSEKAFSADEATMNAIAKTYIGITTEELEQSMVELHEAWRTGALEEYFESYTMEDDGTDISIFTEEELALVEDYNAQLLEGRNYYMADRAEEMLASGDTVFYIVGAAHYYGEEGLVELLTQRGYTVEEYYND